MGFERDGSADAKSLGPENERDELGLKQFSKRERESSVEDS